MLRSALRWNHRNTSHKTFPPNSYCPTMASSSWAAPDGSGGEFTRRLRRIAYGFGVDRRGRAQACRFNALGRSSSPSFRCSSTVSSSMRISSSKRRSIEMVSAGQRTPGLRGQLWLSRRLVYISGKGVSSAASLLSPLRISPHRRVRVRCQRTRRIRPAAAAWSGGRRRFRLRRRPLGRHRKAKLGSDGGSAAVCAHFQIVARRPAGLLRGKIRLGCCARRGQTVPRDFKKFRAAARFERGGRWAQLRKPAAAPVAVAGAVARRRNRRRVEVWGRLAAQLARRPAGQFARQRHRVFPALRGQTGWRACAKSARAQASQCRKRTPRTRR